MPAGLSPGDVMAVSTAWGGEFEISVPTGRVLVIRLR